MTNRIRVLHPITRMIIGGAQENTMLTAQLLAPETWDVDVVCGPQTGSEGSLIEPTRERGISLLIEPTLVREISLLKDARAFFRLRKLMRDGAYDVVHTHSSKAGILGRWAAKAAGVPVIIHTVHGWGHHERQHPLVRWFYVTLEKLTLPITDKLIVVSGLNIDKGLADGIGTRDDYVVIRSGIEMDRFGNPQRSRDEMRSELGIPHGALVIGTVTRLSPQKAPLDFVEMAQKIASASKIAAQNSDTYFVMVGDGPLRGEVEAAIAAAGLSEQFVLTGLRRDVPELLTVFDVFALTSLWEGLPRVLPQAMSTVLPVVATTSDGNAEIVSEGKNGFLVPPGDTTQIAELVLSLLNDPGKRRQMGEAGREIAKEYDVRHMVSQIDALYRELMA